MVITKEDKPDLIVLDVLMPKQSGIRLYHNLYYAYLVPTSIFGVI